MTYQFVDARHVLAVQDLPESTRFYTDVLGFQLDPVNAKRWSFLSRGAVKLMLGECADDVAAAEVGSHSWFIRIAVDQVDDLYADLAARGVTVLIEPSTREYGLREFVIQTPDGHRIMFAEPVAAKEGDK
jgi:catechol 2,3-dioxygenase-like lactoylglutathione lyase family enzyme